MALSAPAALVLAHYRGLWNAGIRQSVYGARALSAIAIGVTAVLLLPIGFFVMRFGAGTGGTLSGAADPEALALWTSLQALFTLLFPLLGAFRTRTAFPMSRFGRYPITPIELLIAESPAATAEAFPILGIGGVLFSSAGFAFAFPAAVPVVLLMVLASIVSFISTMFIGAAILALIRRSRVATVTAMAVPIAAMFTFGWAGIRIFMKEWLPAIVRSLPLTNGWQAVTAVREGKPGEAALLVGWAMAATALVAVAAAMIHHRRVVSDSAAGWKIAGERPLRFSSPSDGISRLFFRQILGSQQGRIVLVVSLVMTASLAVVNAAVLEVARRAPPLEGDPFALLDRVVSLPWFAVLPIPIIVAMGAQVWVNQFGFDGGSIRGLLTLPIAPREILVGKTLGLARYTALQLAAASLPLLLLRAPSIRHVVAGLALAVAGTVVAAGVGQGLSVRFPKRISAEGMSNSLPLYLSFLPVLLAAALGALAMNMYVLGDAIGRGMGALLMIVLAAATILLYRAVLPRLAEWLETNRERLLAM